MPILFLIVFVDLVGFGLVIPLLPFYAERFAASPEQVTVLLAVYSFMAMLSAPFWGRLSDRIGRRPVLMVSLAAASLAYLWLGFADALWMLYAARALAGACAGNIAAAQAYVADVTTPEKRARGMGMIGAAFGIGFIIGPAIGGIVTGNTLATADMKAPGLIAAGLSLAAFLGVVALLKESLPAGVQLAARRSRFVALKGALGRPTLARLLLIFLLVILAFSAMESTFALWAIAQFHWGPSEIGYTFTYFGFLSAMVQGGLIGRLTRRLGEAKLMLGGLVLVVIGLVLLPFAGALPLLIVALTGLSLGLGATQPSLNSLISREAGGSEQGEIMGVSQSVGAFSRVVGPILAGVLFAQFGRSSPFWLGAVLVGAAFFLGLTLIGKRGIEDIPGGAHGAQPPGGAG